MFEAFLQPAFATGLALGGSLIIAIGAQNAFVLRQGLRREHVAAVVAVCALLDIVLMSAGVGGLGALVGAHPRWLDVAALAGAAVLVAYGVAAFRRAARPQTLQAQANGSAQPLRRVLLQVLGISLLNPHVYLDTVVLVGAIGARQPAAGQLPFLLGACTASVLWFTTLGFGARALSPLFARPGAWRVLDVIVALTMWGIAAQLAWGVLTR
jgi:L-lysine exporter family protein LysE/ArgO